MKPTLTLALGLSSLAALALAGACGGKTVGPGNEVGSSSNSETRGSSATNSSSRSSSSTFSTSGSSGGQCIDVAVGPSDTTCESNDDCTSVTTGHLCPSSCQCGGTAANNAAAARIENEIAGVAEGECHCPAEGQALCMSGQCTLCGGFLDNTTPCPIDGGTNDFDGGADANFETSTFTNDAGATCVDVDLSTFDLSCQQASDCVSIFTGQLCVPSDCPCTSAFINTSGQPRYDEIVNSLPASAIACSCPAVGAPTCVDGLCVP